MTSRMPRAGALIAAVSVASAALAGCESGEETASERETIEVTTTVTVTADPTDAPSSFNHYVALGDSYAAMGSASGPFTGPDFCARSEDNYPHVLAETYSGINATRGFTDASCQGSTTEHIADDRDISDQNVPQQVKAAKTSETSSETTSETSTRASEPSSGVSGTASSSAASADTITAQIEALEPDTDLITLSIGGNDINFGPWSRCITGLVEGEGESACDDGLYDDTSRALVDLPTRLDKIYKLINEKAPDAMVITTGYMPLLSMEDNCEATADFPGGTLNWAAGLTVTMNAIARDAAARNGALFVMPPNAEFHSVCAPAPERWTDITGKETDSFPAHPTAAGQRAMAEAVADVLKKL